jgi:hypothetical protein
MENKEMRQRMTNHQSHNDAYDIYDDNVVRMKLKCRFSIHQQLEFKKLINLWTDRSKMRLCVSQGFDILK